MEHKAEAEIRLIYRELRQSINLEVGLIKEKTESDYWNRFEIQYWQHIRLLLENHIN